MALKWNQRYAFPLIAKFIEQKSHSDGEFIDRDTLAAALLADTEAAKLIHHRALTSSRPAEWHASNMVDWFSSKYTDHLDGKADFEYAQFIERARSNKSEVWAYRIKSDLYAGEIADVSGFVEGATVAKYVNAYERNQAAREECISYYGKACAVCMKTLEEVYGSVAKELIHVHHLRPISKIGHAYQVNPIEDLCPVCPNCHAVIHLKDPPFTIRQAQALLADAKVRSDKR